MLHLAARHFERERRAIYLAQRVQRSGYAREHNRAGAADVSGMQRKHKRILLPARRRGVTYDISTTDIDQ